MVQPLPKMQSNPLAAIQAFTQPRRNQLAGLASGLLSANDWGQGLSAGFAQAAQGRQADDLYAQTQKETADRQAKLEQTISYLRSQPGGSRWADAAMNGAVDPQDAFKLWYDESKGGAGGDESFYGTVVPMQDASGKTVLGQISNSGRWQPLQGADGMSPAPTTKTQDTGTEIITFDVYGNELFRTPKQNFSESYDKAAGGAAGKFETEQRLSAPGDVAAGQNAVALIDNVRNDPALQTATGLSGVVLNQVPGFDQLGFARKVDQLKSGAFLSAIEQLRGMGALSNAEGQTATAAITRLSTDLSAADFLEALGEYEAIVKQGVARAQSKMGSPASGPAVGAVEDGYQYMGGDPSNPNSWKRM